MIVNSYPLHLTDFNSGSFEIELPYDYKIIGIHNVDGGNPQLMIQSGNQFNATRRRTFHIIEIGKATTHYNIEYVGCVDCSVVGEKGELRGKTFLLYQQLDEHSNVSYD